MHVNPFAGLSVEEMYDRLRLGRLDLPKWPTEDVQRAWVAYSGVGLLRRSLHFIDMLDQDGAFAKEGWRGLDYGCGWGRFASVLLTKGSADQLDLADAWEKTLRVIRNLNYRNKIYAVSELLLDDELPFGYDFVLSFSVFTHLSPDAFRHNLTKLLKLLKAGGRLYITVRHAEFLDHLYRDDDDKTQVEQAKAELAIRGSWFRGTGGYGRDSKAVFGNTVVTPDFINEIAVATYLGKPHDLQHVYRVEPR
jgi:SAM-dependent methyltransferase